MFKDYTLSIIRRLTPVRDEIQSLTIPFKTDDINNYSRIQKVNPTHTVKAINQMATRGHQTIRNLSQSQESLEGIGMT